MPDINSDIQYLKGVGPAYAKKFAKLGIYTIRDLLLHYPRRYIDYSQPYTVVSAPFDVDCCVKATVLQRDPDRRIKGGRMLSHVLAGDDTGMLALSWFNAPYAAEKLEPGTEYYFEGRVGGMMTRREILHPLVRTEAQVAAAPLLPVYGSTEGLPAARLTRQQNHRGNRPGENDEQGEEEGNEQPRPPHIGEDRERNEQDAHLNEGLHRNSHARTQHGRVGRKVDLLQQAARTQ